MNLTQTLRPASLDEMIGHEKIITELKQRSSENNFPQTMFFAGKTGVGKTTLQRIIAKNILCQNKDSRGYGCNTCAICKSIDDEKPALNYFEFDGYDLGIDKVRDIEELASKRSAFDKTNKKVFVIDELQALNRNTPALKKSLKFLERKYKDVYFILGAMEWIKLPEAIKSRTVMYKLDPIPEKDIATYLYKHCESQKIAVDTEEKANVLLAIGYSSMGSVRTAVSLLERVIYGNIWTEQELQTHLKVYHSSKINSIIMGVLQGKIETMADIEIDTDVLDTIRKRLNLIFKFKSGLELSSYDRSELTGIDSAVDRDKVKYFITQLCDLMKYDYVSPELIEFTFINIINTLKPDRPTKNLNRKSKP
jgi:DNA polymerase-3 subunit gamma/tau